MANQTSPWPLMDNFQIAGQNKKPLVINAPFDVALASSNPGLSLEQANAIVKQREDAIRSGLTGENQQTQQNLNNGYAFNFVPFSKTKEGIAALSEEKAREQEALGLQREGIKSAEDRLKSYVGKESQLDLTPLVSLVDNWTGSNLLRGYKAPTSEEQRSRAAQELQDAILKAKTGYSANVIQGLKNSRSDRQSEYDDMLRAKIAEAQIAATLSGQKEKKESQAPEKEIALIDKISRSKESDVIKGSIEMNNALNNYVNTIKKHQGNITSSEARADIGQAYNDTLMAFKNANVLGALAQADLETAKQKLPDMSSFSSYIKRFGGVTPDINVTTKLISDMKKGYASKGQQAIKTLEDGYGKFGGRDLLNRYKSDLNSTMESTAPSRKEKEQQLYKLMQSQGVTQ